MEALGRARVVIRDGRVVEVGEPLIEYCPLFHAARGIERITKRAIRENIAFRIKDVGMFTSRRSFESGKFVDFGVSEILMSALTRGLLDATVTVCDGAGTVISDSAELVQAIGARMSGLVSTSPIASTIEHIKGAGGHVLDEHHATIDQPRGLERAIALGYRRIGVTVSTVEDARACRRLERDGVSVALFGVHVTGLTQDEAREMAELVDVMTACASRHVREQAGERALLQAGASVPVFALTQLGKELILERIRDVSSPMLIRRAKLPHIEQDKSPRPLV